MYFLKRLLVTLTIILSSTPFLFAQLNVKAVSTGRTTGHIATLTVTNSDQQSVPFKLRYGIIPSKEFKTDKGIKKSQPQIHTGNINQVIEAGETIEIPVTGFCLDVGKPPLQAGETFPPIDEWVLAIPTSPEPWGGAPTGGRPKFDSNKLPNSFKPLEGDKGDLNTRPIHIDQMNPVVNTGKKESVSTDEINPSGLNSTEWGLTIPGTAVPFNYTIDISKNPEDAALIIFPVVENIEMAYDDLFKQEQI